MSAFSGMLLIKAWEKMFKEYLVLYEIIQAAFSYTVYNSWQMNLSELPCVFSRDPSNLPRESLEEVYPNTADHKLILCFFLCTFLKNAGCDNFCSIAFITVVKLWYKPD